jgi:hypothetical protein
VRPREQERGEGRHADDDAGTERAAPEISGEVRLPHAAHGEVGRGEKAHSASAKAPSANENGVSHGAKPLVTTPAGLRGSPRDRAPTTIPSSTGATVLALENRAPSGAGRPPVASKPRKASRAAQHDAHQEERERHVQRHGDDGEGAREARAG